MKLLVFCCLFVFVISEALALGYHQDVGIPEATRIKEIETKQMSSRIVGGQLSKWGDNPYLAGLIITLTTKQISVCSGTYLKPNKVLTAAQCWYDGYSQGRKIEVVLGSTKLFYGYRNEATRVSVHPLYDPSTLKDDLAMLTLRWSQATHVDTVGPDTSQHAVSLPVSNPYWYNNCYRTLPTAPANTDNMICTKKSSSGWIQGTCGADLGGPLVVENYYKEPYYNGSALLIGVTSIQPFGCQTALPTGYVRVTKYLSWILQNL